MKTHQISLQRFPSITLPTTCMLGFGLMITAAHSAVIGPYTSDANTLALYHFDEAPGAADPGNPIANSGTGGTSLNLTNTGGPDGRNNTGSGGYQAAGASNFGSSFDVLLSGDGNYKTAASTVGGGLTTTTTTAQSALQGATGSFTYEALIYLGNGTTAEQNILSHDGGTDRGFLFRVTGGTLALYNGNTASNTFSKTIPTIGEHAFANNTWFHVAITYTGVDNAAGNLAFYWTALDSTATQANLLGTSTMAADVIASTNSLGVGTSTRDPFRFQLQGLVDEVRISDIARGADQFIFVPEPGSAMLTGLGVLLAACRRKRCA